MIVRENLNFERGKNSKSSLNIGKTELMKDPEYLIKTMAKELDFIDRAKLHSTGNFQTIFYVFYEKGLDRDSSDVNAEIYNWIEYNTDHWKVNDFSHLSLINMIPENGYWNIITLKSLNG